MERGGVASGVWVCLLELVTWEEEGPVMELLSSLLPPLKG